MAEQKKKRYSKNLRRMKVDIEERDGKEQEYELRGLTGPGRDQWIKLRDSVTVDGKIDPEQQTPLIAKLLSLALFGPDGQAIMEEEAAVLPSETQIGLFQDALTLSGLDEGAQVAAKNA